VFLEAAFSSIYISGAVYFWPFASTSFLALCTQDLAFIANSYGK